MTRNRFLGFLAVLALIAATAFWIGTSLQQPEPASVTVLGEAPATVVQPAALPEPAQQQVREVPRTRQQLQLSFAPVVSQVTPSVVNVYATTVRQQTSPYANDPFFQRFFGGRGELFQSRPRESQSLGSGVVVESSGIILTNSHVVSGATDIRIALQDGREYAVDLVLDDPETDLAVLRIRDPEGRSFPALTFANSDDLQVGDLVLAIGNPFGVGQTVTSGIVSALARTGVESSDYEFFIQTDAAINPGNSGGALVDLNGHLVGINTAIYSRSGGSVGIGFAIPSNMAAVVAQAGIAGGKIVRPWFGALTQQVTSDIADSLHMDPPRGVILTDVAEGGPAARAGLRAGDVVQSIDGTAVNNPQALDFRLATHPIGSTAKLQFFRGGQTLETDLPVEAPPAPERQVTIEGNTRFEGTTAAEMTPALAQEFGLAFDAKGVIVTEVADGSAAQQMGLRRGDIILGLQNVAISDVNTFQQVASQRVRAWQVVLQREGRVLRTVVSG